MLKRIIFILISSFSGLLSNNLLAQNQAFVNNDGDLILNVFVSNPCDGNNNGYIEFTIVQSDGEEGGTLNIVGPFSAFSIPLNHSETYRFNSLESLVPGNYGFLVSTPSGDFINEAGASDGVTLYPLDQLEFQPGNVTISDNTSCVTPNGNIEALLSGGSQDLPDGGSYNYTITTDNGLFTPITGTYDGTTPLNIANIAGTGLRGGDYTIDIEDDYSVCSYSQTFSIEDPSPEEFNLTSASPPIICLGDDLTLSIDGSELGVTYTAYVNDIPTTAIGTGDGTPPVEIQVSSSDFIENDIITVIGTNGFCTPVEMTGSVTVDIQDFTINSTVTNNTKCTIPFNGAIDVTIGDAVGALSYVWSGPNSFNSSNEDISALSPGNYSLIVTDATTGCSETFPDIVVGDNPPTITVTLQTRTHDTSCDDDNGSIDISVSGGTSYSYSWTDGDTYSATTQDIEDLPAGVYTVTVTDAVSGCTGTLPVTINEVLPDITVTGTVTHDTSCTGDNGTIGITAGGGTSYSYSWTGPGPFTSTSEDLTGLAAGTYEVTVTDNTSGCSEVQQFIINNSPATITVTLDSRSHDTSCSANNGSINITATGGSTYTYSWTSTNGFTSTSADISGLAAGDYTVVVTDNASGCTGTLPVTINEVLPDITVTGTVTHDTSCTGDNGTIDITAGGGTSYSYSWTGPGPFTSTSEDLTGLAAGTYEVTVTDNTSGCSEVQQFIINNSPATITVTLDSRSHDTSCSANNGSINITATGGSTYTYSWTSTNGFTSTSADISGLAAGDYTVVVTDNASGCTGTLPVTINEVLPDITVTGTVTHDTSCTGDNGTIDITAGGGTSYSYSWTGPGPFTSTSEDLTGLAAGTYEVTVTDNTSGCSEVQQFIINNSPATITVTLDSRSHDTSCSANNGSINITATGGSTYTYSWTSTNGFTSTSADISGLAAGDYTVVVTDNASGCTGTLPVTINEVLPDITVTGTVTHDTSCTGDNGTIGITAGGGTSYSYSWTGPGPFTSTSEDLTGLAAGTYEVTVTDNTSGCSEVQQFIINNSPATITVTLDSRSHDTSCSANNGSINITATGGSTYTYSWTSTNGFTSTSADISGLAAGDYTVVVTDNASGCTGTLPVTINEVLPDITVTGTVTHDTSCTGDNGTIGITAGGGTSYSYSWTGPGPFTSTSEDLTGLAAGTYEVTVTDNTSGCSEVQQFIINNSPATITVTLDSRSHDTSCSANNGSINITATGGSTYAYSWTSTNGFTSTSADISGLAAGDYTVVVTDNASGCTGTLPVTINEVLPDITVTGTVTHDTSCTGDNGTIDITAGGGTSYSYSWTGPGPFTSTSEDLTGLAAGTYEVTVTDNTSGCSEVQQFIINNSPATITVTLDSRSHDTSCSANNGSINITATGGSTYTYSWTSTNGFTSTSADISGLAAGDYTVVVTDNASGCTGTLPVTINEVLPDITVTGTVTHDTSCTGDNGTINITAAGGTSYSYSWTGPGPFTSTSEDLTGLAAGTYEVTVTDNTSGCSEVQQFIINNSPATITVTLDSRSHDTSCSANNGSINITATGGSTYAYSWTSTNGFTSTSADISGLAAGDYTVVVTDNASGCTESLLVTINNDSPSLTITIDSQVNDTDCNSGNGSINISLAGATGTIDYSWTGPNDFASTLEDISNLEGGTYTVIATDNGSGCSESESITISGVDAPVAQLTSSDSDNTICEGESVTFTATPSNATNYEFFVDGVSVKSSTEDFYTTSSLANAESVTVEVTGTNSCEDTSDPIVTTVVDLPVAGLTSSDSDNTICEGESVTFTATPSNATNYEFFVDGVSVKTSTEDFYTTTSLANAESVTVEVAGTNSCEDTSDPIVTTVVDLPVAGLTSSDSDNTICAGESVTFTATPSNATNYEFFVDGVSVKSSTEDFYTTSSLANAESVTVEVTETNSCEDTSDPIVTTVVDLPVAGLTSSDSDNTICEGESVTFTATPSNATNYEFFVDGVSVKTSTEDFYTTSSLANAESVTVEVAGTNSCEDTSDPIVTTVVDLPVAGLTSSDSDNTICEGESVTFTATPSNATNYEFFVDGVSVKSSTEDFYTTSSLANAESVTVEVTGTNSCEDTSDPIVTTVVDLPVAELTSSDSDNTICEGESVTFTATPSNATNYEFFVDGVSVKTSTEDFYTTSSLADAESVTVEVTGANNCEDTSDPIVTTVVDLPVAGLTSSDADNTICAGESVTFTATPSSATNYEFFVDGVSVKSSTEDFYTTTSLANAESVTVEVTGTNSCEDTSDPIITTVVDIPVAGLTSSDNNNRICAGEEVIFTASPSGAANYNFLLNGVSVQASASESFATNSLADGDEVSVVITNSTGCFDTSSVITTTVFSITAGLSDNDDDDTICEGESVTFTATPGGATNYNFLINSTSVQDGTSDTFTSNSLSDQDEISVVITGSNSCSDTSDVIIFTVNPLPTVSISADDETICEGEEIIFTASPADQSNYEFFVNNVTAQNGAEDIFTGSNLNDGDIIHVEVTSPNGCSSESDEITITVNTPEIAELESSDDDNIVCADETVTFTAIPSSATNYNFFINGVNVQSGVEDAFVSTALSNNDEIYVEITDINGCTSLSDTITNSVIELTAGIVSDDDDNTICSGEEVVFIAAPGNAVNYDFIINGVSVQSSASNGFSTTGISDGDEIYVNVLGAGGCSAMSDTIDFNVNSSPVSEISSSDEDGVICQGEEVIFTATPSGATNYEFYLNGVSVQSGIEDSFVTNSLADGDAVNVVITNSSNCSSSAYGIIISVDETPNAGEDATTTICIDNSSFDLLNALNGTPENGGTWIETSGVVSISGNIADFTSAPAGSYTFEYTITSSGACPDDISTLVVNVVDEFNAGTDNTIEACTSDNSVDIFAALGTADAGGVWTDNDGIGGLNGNIWDASFAEAGNFYSFTYLLTGEGCADVSATITINVITDPDAGEDNDISVCSTENQVDLFDALNGTPEAGGDWVDFDETGASIINGNLSLNGLTAGTYRFDYVISSTTCDNDTATVTLQLNDPLDAGTDNTVEICAETPSFNLFNALGGSPDNGGNWVDLDNSGAQLTGDLADFTGVEAGTYTFSYSISNGTCDEDVAFVSVTIIDLPNAGDDSESTACIDDPSFNLFNALNGFPETGGIWTDLDATGATLSDDIADFTGVPEGSYEFEYAVSSTSCGIDVAILTVNISSTLDAGTDNTITVCTSEAPVNLFDELGGTPDNGGTWTDNDGVGGLTDNIFDVTSSTAVGGESYTFTYSLSGVNCTPSSSTITINVAEGGNAGTGTTVATCKDNTGLNLFASLGGNPDTGGTWTDLDGIGGLSGDFLNVNGSNAIQGNSYRFEYTIPANGSCSAISSIVTVTIRLNSDPACGGVIPGEVNCSLFSYDIDLTLPTCGEENGVVAFSDIAYDGTALTDYSIALYRIVGSDTIPDISVPNPTNGTISTRRAGIYTYEVINNSNGMICEGFFELPFKMTVTADTVAGTKQNIQCFGADNGSIQVTVADSQTGEYYYSIGGGGNDPANWTLLSGNRLITGLPAGFTEILIGEEVGDSCPAVLGVFIESEYSQLSAQFTITEATCDRTDGALTVTSLSGGSGDYDFRLKGIFYDNLPTNNTFTNLTADSVLFTIIDEQTNCERDYKLYIPFPGFVDFDAIAISPDCNSDNADNGEIEIYINQEGTFNVGISNAVNSEPSEFFTVGSQNDNTVAYTFEDLAQGKYYITVELSGATCPNKREVIISGGAVAVDFTTELTCIDGDLALILENVSIEENVDFEVAIFRNLLSQAVFVETYSQSDLTVNDELILEDINLSSGINLSEGNYNVRISQSQSTCSAGNKVLSDLMPVSIPSMLQFSILEDSTSIPFPEEPNGFITLGDFNGGFDPYVFNIVLNEPTYFQQSYELVQDSVKGSIHTVNDLPSGIYIVQMVDSLGCYVTTTHEIRVDERIFIPNVITPNGDGANDTFIIRNLPDFDTELIITNRWGKEIYSSSSYQNDWAGEDSLDGIYFYQLNVAGQVYNGWVQIVRGNIE